MKTPADDRLVREARDFAFRFACDDCAHFDAARPKCSLGYPAAPRRGALAVADGIASLYFCKAFELA